jgi:phage-related protein
VVAIVGEAGVKLRPEASRFGSEAESEISGSMPGVAKKAAGFFVAAFAAVKVGGFLKDAVGAASDLSESTSKVGVVFGDASQQVLDFAANASSAFGQSRGQALEAAGTFGNLLRSIGLTEDASAKMSTSMVGLASDLASFNNTDPAEALDALRAGLTGETEPLKRYGINLNDATLKQEAMRLGLDTSGSTLSANTKAQAAYSLIMSQSSLAQGDFLRTSQGLANQQRIMASQWTDLSANIGGLFVPMLGNASGLITGGLMPALLRITSTLPELGSALGSIGDYFTIGLNDGAEAATKAAADVGGLGHGILVAAGAAGNFRAIFGEAMADGKAGADLLAADGMDGLAARAGVAAFRIRQDLGAAFLSVRASVAPALAPLAGTFANVAATARASFGQIFAGLGGGEGGGLAGFAAMIGGALNRVIPIITPILQQVIGAVQGFLPVIGQTLATLGPIIGSVVSQIGPLLAQIGPMLGQIIPVVVQIAGIWQHVLMAAFQALLPVLPVIVQALGQLVTALVSGLAPVFTALAPVIGQVVGVISGALTTAISALVPVIGPLTTAIVQVVQVLGGALLTVIQQLAPIIPVLVGVIGQLAGVFAETLGGILTALAPVLPVLARAFASIATAIGGALSQLLAALLPILPPIAEAFGQIAQVLAGVLADALGMIIPILPTIIDALLQLVMAAIMPILPLLPMLAQLLLVVVEALAPLIPPIIQIVTLIIQLAVAALGPVMTLLPIFMGLIQLLLRVITPVISVVGGIIGVFVRMAATVASVVFGFLSTVIGVFTSIWTGISRIVTNIVSGVTGGFRGLVSAIGGIFSGIADTVGGMFEGIGGAIKSALNGIIRLINNTIIWGVNELIDGVNLVNPFDDIPHIPKIPTLHASGVVDWGPGGEGLAILRSQEMVATPEQRALGEGLLEGLLTGRLPGAAGAGAAGGGAAVTQHIYAAEGMSVAELSARIATDLGWSLSSGTTTPPPRFAGSPS